MRYLSLVSALFCLVVPSLGAQVSEADLQARIVAAQEDPTPLSLLQAANAARLLGDYELADSLLGEGRQGVGALQNFVLTESIMLAMASGRGADGMQRALRDFRKTVVVPPIVIANVTNSFPTLLSGGEFDDMILSMSVDNPDPEYRCTCWAQKAWVHRLAGRPEQAVPYWDSIATAQLSNPNMNNPDLQAQIARNLARAGRTNEARAKLQEAMQMELTEAQRPAVQRRWAQALAELGDVEGAVAQLEPLLMANTLVTVESLETRMTWEPIRDDPAFQALLDRHR